MKVQRTTITARRVDLVIGDKPDPEEAKFWVHVVVDFPKIEARWPVEICRALAVAHALEHLHRHNEAAVMEHQRIWEDALEVVGPEKPG